LKIIDRFLKFLKTDKNTFLTYILTIFSIYITVDRLVELLFLIFSGTSVSYWGPIKYTFALACPVFAFLFSGASSFCNSRKIKISFFYLYCISLYIIGISMVIQWGNLILWLLFTSVPNYVGIVTQFPELIKPAFTSLALYLPIITVPMLFKFIYTGVNDTLLQIESIYDYGGINLKENKSGIGPYSCEVPICLDLETGKTIKIPENQRYESALIVGGSGTGKTTMVFEPMIAADLEKKYFFKEVSKELGFTSLKTGIATINAPYDDTYLNKNFNLNMLTPKEGKETVFKTFMKKMIYANSSNIIYKNIGLTYVAPDFESISHILEVADNFDLKVNLVDPDSPASIGLNPFVNDNPSKIAIIISSALKAMYQSTHTTVEEAFMENIAIQAIENISILLKEMYPLENDGLLPNLEDMLKCLNNFELVENLCERMKLIPELAEKYSLQIGYFEKHFYKNGIAKQDTEKYVYSVVTLLDNLLRYPGVKGILCNRTNNVDFDTALANGEVTLLCTRRGDLGATAHKAFGLFFILLMQQSVLTRPGSEATRIPHFLYIDEFSDFICQATDSIFTLYRKYHVGIIISAQNLAQLGKDGSKYRQTILTNCSTKIVFGGNTPEENEFWALAFGNKRTWKFTRDYNLDNSEGKAGAVDKLGNPVWDWKKNFVGDKVRSLGFKICIYTTKNNSGTWVIGDGKVDFLDSKYKEKHRSKTYNFSRFINEFSAESQKTKPEKFVPKKIEFVGEHNVDPIQTDTTDLDFLFDNDDAVVFDIKKKKN